jgi:carbonic anhydrase/acetyltransferase-like protein (isoleucine patch superfamily)
VGEYLVGSLGPAKDAPGVTNSGGPESAMGAGAAAATRAAEGAEAAEGATPAIHPEAWIAPGAVVVGSVTLGRAASVWYAAVLRADDDEIVVGAECNIQDQCCLHVDPGEPVVLEERVSVGHHATVHGAYVGAGALIGIGAVVLGRSRVGAGSLVAAGTVIRPGQQVPPGVLVAGVPGRVVRVLTDEDRASFADTAARYVARAARHRAAGWNRRSG